MIAEKTIQICGQDVQMRYCAAAETGYERLSGKSSNVFTPTVAKRGEDGKPVKINPPEATAEDYLTLALAAIIAAYGREDKEPPVSSKDILYDATPEEVSNLITAIIELRSKWYDIPSLITTEEHTDEAEQKEEEESDAQKNA